MRISSLAAALAAVTSLSLTTPASADPTFALDLGLALDHTAVGLSGAPFPDGVPVTDQRTDTTRLSGDLRLGVEGRAGYAGYLALSGAADLDGRPALRASELRPTDAALHRQLVHPYGDAFGFVHHAWAQLDGLGAGELAARFTLRVGRQFHWGARPITFDGVTLGYTSEAVTLALYGGRRSGVYALAQDDPGLVGGARMLVDFGAHRGPPLTLRAEYQVLHRQLDLDPLGLFRYDAATTPGPVDSRLGLGELALWYDVSRDLLLELRLDLLDATPSHLRAGARWVIGNTLVSLDLDQKLGEDAPYDLAAGRSLTAFDPRTRLDRPTTYEALRLNIPDRHDYTDLEARVTVEPVAGWAIEPYGRLYVVHADPTERTPWDADRHAFGLRASGALRLTPTTGLELEAGYDGELIDRGDVSRLELLDDVAAGPETARHAISGGVRWVAVETPTRGRRLLTDRWLTLGLWGVGTRYVLGGRYEEDTEDLLAVQAETKVRLGGRWTVEGRYEFAQAASVMHPELGAVHFALLRVGVGW